MQKTESLASHLISDCVTYMQRGPLNILGWGCDHGASIWAQYILHHQRGVEKIRARVRNMMESKSDTLQKGGGAGEITCKECRWKEQINRCPLHSFRKNKPLQHFHHSLESKASAFHPQNCMRTNQCYFSPLSLQYLVAAIGEKLTEPGKIVMQYHCTYGLKSCVFVLTCNYSIEEADSGLTQVQGHLRLYSQSLSQETKRFMYFPLESTGAQTSPALRSESPAVKKGRRICTSQ